MSECPKLTGDLVYAYVTGLQNNSETLTPTSPPLLTVACCKHYAVYNVETIPTDRHHFNAVVNARDLWETYLPVFEQCINKAKGQSIMCSYNEVNGIPACANGGLITDVARGAFSFDGFVMSDYDAWQEMVTTHAWAANWTVAAVAGLSAGLDQEGGGGPVYEPVQIGIPDAFNTGLITLANLTVPVRRLMRARLRLGMFDPPASVAYNYLSLLDVASPDKVALAEKAARAGITLLKNTGSALPLSLSSGIYHKIALVGPNANSSYGLLGSYSDPFCCGVGIPSILQELSYRVAGAGVDFSYGSGCVDPNCVDNSLFGDATRAAANADAVVIAIGMGNSNYDCGGASNRDDCEAEDYDRPTCALPGKQAQLVAAVKFAMKPGAPLIAVLIHGSSLCIDPTTLASLDAVLAAWYPGERGGPAIADALIGAFSPAGRSPVSWYASDAALPSDRGQMSPYEIPGVSPGITYRFYNQSSPLGAPLLFTFGQGLTYSTFSSSNPVFPTSVGPCDDINVTVTVTNTGSVDSDIVVALFLAQPDVTVPTPLTRLVSFIRVHIAAKNSLPVTLPAIPKEARFVVHDDGTSSVYDIAQKRWNEQGRLNFHVSLGEYGSDMSGSSPFTVQQSSSQNIDTC
jgi:beta-glucosidase-like glycosyl hydrolase